MNSGVTWEDVIQVMVHECGHTLGDIKSITPNSDEEGMVTMVIVEFFNDENRLVIDASEHNPAKGLH